MGTCKIRPLTCNSAEPPIGIEPMTYALRGARSRAVHALAAPIAPKIAQMELTALGLSGHPFHDPFHARRPYIPAMHTADLPMAARRADSG
jgi:hypothetical protein